MRTILLQALFFAAREQKNAGDEYREPCKSYTALASPLEFQSGLQQAP
jgi:hypothetical protein